MLTRIACDLSQACCRVEFRKTGRVDARLRCRGLSGASQENRATSTRSRVDAAATDADRPGPRERASSGLGPETRRRRGCEDGGRLPASRESVDRRNEPATSKARHAAAVTQIVQCRARESASARRSVDAAATKPRMVRNRSRERRSARRAGDLGPKTRRRRGREDADGPEPLARASVDAASGRPRSEDASTPRLRSSGWSGTARESVGRRGERATSVRRRVDAAAAKTYIIC